MDHVSFVYDIVHIVIITFLGLCFGSFASALIYRIPLNIPFVFHSKKAKPIRSACPKCGHVLSTIDLIPVLSYMFTAGKCRYCGANIGAIYPVLELGTAGLCVLIYIFLGISANAVLFVLLIPFLISMLVIDIRHYRIPNILVVIMAALGLIRIVYMSIYLPLTHHGLVDPVTIVLPFISAIIFGGFAFAIRGLGAFILRKEALGMGDVKLFAAIGLWLPVSMLPNFLILAGGIGIVFGIIWRLTQKTNLFPFGPAIIVSFSICFLLKALEINTLLIKI